MLLDNYGPQGMIPEDTNERCNEGRIKDKGKIRPVKTKEVKQLNEKALNEEFLKVFETINDDFIHVEPKLIPIIPGDDPAIINKQTDYFDDN